MPNKQVSVAKQSVLLTHFVKDVEVATSVQKPNAEQNSLFWQSALILQLVEDTGKVEATHILFESQTEPRPQSVSEAHLLFLVVTLSVNKSVLMQSAKIQANPGEHSACEEHSKLECFLFG